MLLSIVLVHIGNDNVRPQNYKKYAWLANYLLPLWKNITIFIYLGWLIGQSCENVEVFAGYVSGPLILLSLHPLRSYLNTYIKIISVILYCKVIDTLSIFCDKFHNAFSPCNGRMTGSRPICSCPLTQAFVTDDFSYIPFLR